MNRQAALASSQTGMHNSAPADHDPDRCQAEISQLRDALARARRIGAAVGIVMISLQLPEDQAFAFLVDASQRLNRKLRALADTIVLTGELPPAYDGSGA